MAAVDLLRDRFNEESVRVSVLVVGRGPGLVNSGWQEPAKVDTIGAPALPIEFYDADEPARVTPQLVFDEAERALEGLRASVSSAILLGRPVDALVQWLTDEQPTVVLIGSRGRGRAERWLLGSVSTGVAFRAPCCVLVMRPPSEGAHTLIGYDQSDDVEATFPLLGQMLPPTSPLKLLTVVRHRALFPASVRPHVVDSLVRASARPRVRRPLPRTAGAHPPRRRRPRTALARPGQRRDLGRHRRSGRGTRAGGARRPSRAAGAGCGGQAGRAHVPRERHGAPAARVAVLCADRARLTRLAGRLADQRLQ